MYDKFSLVLLLIHWLDCNREKITAEAIKSDYEKGYHKRGCGINITLSDEEINETLCSLVNFQHLVKQDDNSYFLKPMGRCVRYKDDSTPEFLYHGFAGKLPLELL